MLIKEFQQIKKENKNNSSLLSEEELLSIYKKEIKKVNEFPHFLILDLTEEEIRQYYFFFKEIMNQTVECMKLKDRCSNHLNVHLDVCRGEDNKLYFFYTKCVKMEKIFKEKSYKEKYLYHYYSDTFLTDVKLDKKWIGNEVHATKNQLIKMFQQKVKSRSSTGIYIYGTFGIGKTYCSNAFANLFAEKLNKTICFIYVPDFVNMLKDGFNNSDKKIENGKIIQDAQNADVLFLDDMGAEYATDWFYSNILLNLLNQRYANNKITYFNSNLSIDELEKKIKKSLKGDDSYLIAGRIIDRIKTLVDNNFILLKGDNMRHKKEKTND